MSRISDMTTTLVLGGARSGKSRHAMLLAEKHGSRPLMIATAVAGDGEMRRRIALHQQERGEHWTTVEAPFDLAGAVAALDSGATAVVDCLTLWLSNLIHGERDPGAEATRLLEALEQSPARLILVSNEVGLGIVPGSPLGRRFRDEQGRLNRRLAEAADEVVLLAAGLPLTLKGLGKP